MFMKTKIIRSIMGGVLLCAVMLYGMILAKTNKVQAEETITRPTVIYIAGNMMNATSSFSGTGWRYNYGTNTLTLSGGTIAGTGAAGASGMAIYADGDLNVVVTADTVLTSTNNCAIEVGGKLSVTVNEDVKLTIEVAVTDDGFWDCGIVADSISIDGVGCVNIEVTGTSHSHPVYASDSISINSTTVKLQSNGSEGLYAEGDISIEAANITVTSTSSNGVSSAGNLNIHDSVVNVISGGGAAIYALDNIYIEDSELVAKATSDDAYGLYSHVGEITINGSNVTADGMRQYGTPTITDSIVIEGKEINIYGDIILDEDLSIASDERLIINEDAILTVPNGITLDISEGSITNNGVIDIQNGGAVVCDCTGGEATCINKAICEKCGREYGDYDLSNHESATTWSTQSATQHESRYDCCNTIVVQLEDHHWNAGECTECNYSCSHIGNTVIRDDISAEEFKEGYTGDTYCGYCQEKLVTGTTIPATHQHTYGEWVTVKEATVEAEGTKQKSCACGHMITDSIPRLEDDDVHKTEDDNIPKIEDDDIPKTEGDDVPKTEGDDIPPKTGDNNIMMYWILLAIIAGVVSVNNFVTFDKKM